MASPVVSVTPPLPASRQSAKSALPLAGAGVAVTAAGNFVLASGEMQAAIADLLATATPAPASGNADFADCLEAGKGGVTETTGLAIYEITVGPVEGQCGNEPVFGKLCESACASDSRHPWWREGVGAQELPIEVMQAGQWARLLDEGDAVFDADLDGLTGDFVFTHD